MKPLEKVMIYRLTATPKTVPCHQRVGNHMHTMQHLSNQDSFISLVAILSLPRLGMKLHRHSSRMQGTP